MHRERGMTLIEMLIAVVVFSVVLGGALGVFRSQSRGFSRGADRMTVLQNVRFTANVLEANLRTVGSGVPDIQPFLVYVDDDVIAFNVNYTSNVASDVFAVYIEPDAPAGAVTAMTTAMALTIPNSSFRYPDTTYSAGPANSPAETIIFFFSQDSSTARTDDYALFRQANAGPAELVARNLLQVDGEPFFEYYRQVTTLGGAASIQEVGGTELPLAHSVPIHLSPGDTATAAVIDSIRGVRVNVRATNGLSGEAEQIRQLSRLVRLPNAGIAKRKTCGDEPLAVPALIAIADTTETGEPYVQLTWDQTVDEESGESDVMRYVVWRKPATQPEWGDPYLSIPSGQVGYLYEDAAVQSGDTLMYGVAAQDCTPQLSSLASAGPVPIP